MGEREQKMEIPDSILDYLISVAQFANSGQSVQTEPSFLQIARQLFVVIAQKIDRNLILEAAQTKIILHIRPQEILLHS